MDWKTRISALFLWIFVVLSAIGNGNAEKRVVCYYTNWSVYRPGTAKFSPQNINPYLCTHLIYAFGGFTKENTLKPFDKYQDIEKGGYAKFTGLKTYNKDLKTMLAIGGWNEGSSRFSPMVADPGRRKEFVKNTVKFLRQNHFDGLDLDWEYPAFRDGGKPRDRDNYADLVQELREEFERESSKTGRPRLLLSMAVPAGIEYIDKGYDVPRLNEYLDFINLLSYDYHSAYEPAANHHSPLFPLEEDNEYNYDTELTIDFTITHLLKSGASSEKIVLGIPTYGRSYTLFNEEATDIGAPADGPGEEGDATREKGYLAYYEICESIAKSDEWQVVQPNPSAMGPYAFRGNQWVGYDDENIVRAKARYVNEKKLGGIMFWSIDNDDFRGKCHGRPYPLIEAAKEAMLVEDDGSGTKTRVPDSRKKSRPQGGQRPQVNSISRKFKTGRRTTTTETPSTKRRISSGSRSNSRSNGRARGSEDVEDDEEDNEEEANSVKSSEKPRPRTRSKNTRLRNQSLGGGRKKQQNSRNHEGKKNEEPEEEARSKKLTTPEPPTTPDPGTDFKCEDEGFFPHPRDCKKYFWCLDSGPGGLGIVGHQFTCPSGLVFNKAADSCDYPRNVVCPKTKTTQSAVTTTRAPITAATSRTTYLHKPSPRTTTPKADSEEEYEYYDDEEVDEDAADSRETEEQVRSTTTPKTYKTISRNRPTTTNSPASTTTEPTTSTRASKTTTERDTSYEDEEDPRVIKELIDLIKKAGGIEQLEKQLLYQDKNSGGNAETTEGNGKSTPATISRSLYERVLNRQATRIAGGFLGSFSTTQSSKSPKGEENAPKNSRTGFINGPGGAQFEGLDQVPEVKTLRRTTKHQYVTIDRQRQTTSESPTDEDEELDEEDEDDNKNVASSEDRAVSSSQEKSSNRRFPPSYVNIRRSRPSTTTSENDVDLKDEGDDTLEEESGESGELEEPVTEGRKVVKSDGEASAPKSRYTNVQRFRSTTLRQSVEDATEEAPLKKDAKFATSTTSTTTEKIIPVTEEVSETPTTLSSTISESSSSESLENEKLENSTQESSSDDAPSTSEPETTKINNDATLRLVENSATEILLTTVPASSISTGSNYDSFTRGPTVAAVSQPRPFGFSRRGRPTTTAIPPTASPVTEQTRTKVDSETLRLPTLKELVGFTSSTLSKDSSGSQLTKSMTTLPSIDTTIVVNDQRDESEEGELVKNQFDAYDRFEGANESEDSHNLSSESAANEKDILDNDILSSEEIQRRSSPVLTIETEKEPEKVEVPVRILDDTNGEEIAELVLLRVPQSKLSSAALKPILRVKILDQENQEVPGEPGQRKKIEKVENRPESSSENELSDTFRPTSGRRRKINSSRGGQDAEAATEGLQDRPRSRQRIVKARRRTRPLQPQGQDDEVKKTQNEESPRSQGQQIVRKVTRRRENPEKSAPHTTTLIPEVSEPISNTLSPTTLAESYSLASRASNLTRGFYITKDIDEFSTTLDPTTTEFQSTSFDDSSSQEIDFTTQEIGSTTQTPETTIQDVEVTTSQGVETVTFQQRTEHTTESIESSVQVQQPTTSLETATPDYVSTMIDETTESSVPTTGERSNNEPAITTFRPRITEKATTPVESTTTEFFTNSSEELEEDGAVTKSRETSEDHSESLKTSENNYLRSTTIAEPSKIDEESKTSSTGFDEHYEAQGRIFDAKNSTESTKITFDLNEISVTPEMRKFDVETATIPVQSSLDQFSKKVEPEAESSPQKTTTNLNTRTTSRQETTNRGGVRFTTTGKSSIPIDRSSSRNGNETQKSTSENLVSSTNSATTKSYVLTGRSTRNKQETLKTETNTLPPTTPSRRRGNVRRTTRPPKITETTRSVDSSVTDGHKNNVGTRVKDRSTLTTSNYDQANVARTKNSRVSSRGRPNDWRTTESPEIDKTGSDNVTRRTLNSRSTTEAYGEAVESSTRAESSYGTTNFEQETTSSSEASNSFFQVSSEPKKLNESLESRANVIDTSDPNESHVTIPETTESVDKTSRSQEISTNRENVEISSTRSFESPDASSTMSLEIQQSNDSSSNVTSSKFIEETSQATTSSVPTISPTTNFVQATESNFLSSRSSVSGSETTRSFLSEDSNNYSTSIDESWTKIPVTTEIDEETFDTESSAPTTVFPATEFTGSTDDHSEKSTTLDHETNTFSRTIEPLDKNTEAPNSEDTSVTYGVTTSEAKETTSGYEGTSIPWLRVTGNENIDVRETTMVNTLNIIESTTPSYIKNDSYSVVTNLPVEGQRTEGLKKNDVTTEANQKTISDNDISGKSIETTVRIDATTRGTNSPEKESFLHNVIPSRATWTTANWENSVLSTLGASSTSRAPSVQQEPKRPRGRVRFTNFAGISDDANEEARRPIKQLVVRRRLAKDRQRVATTTESNLIKTEASPTEKNQKSRFTRIKNVSARQDVEKKNQIDKSDEITRRIDSKNQNELADRGANEKTNSSKTPRRRVVVYRGRPRPENISTTPKPVTTTAPPTVPSPDVSSGENADNDKSRRRRKWRKRIVLKRSRLEAEEDDQSIAETGLVGRALIDGDYVESSPDAGSYILMPDVVEKSSEPEDSAGEANPFKSSGAFLRRPGTLVRNDALNRLRSKVPKTLVPAPTLVPFAKIQSVDPTYEMKTEDQSVRAQELAVTLSDPPASDPSSTTGRSGLRKQGTTRKISTTVAPRTETTSAPKTATPIVRRRQSPRRNNNNLGVVETPVRPRRPAIIDYDYYVDDEIRLVLKPELKDKLFVTKKGGIRCLDQGNFAHPTSCKKFITCARMGNGQVVGTEYTCPDKLSFDPVGGICNWSAGLGCEDKTKTSK